jgi:hypothetical protein
MRKTGLKGARIQGAASGRISVSTLQFEIPLTLALSPSPNESFEQKGTKGTKPKKKLSSQLENAFEMAHLLVATHRLEMRSPPLLVLCFLRLLWLGFRFSLRLQAEELAGGGWGGGEGEGEVAVGIELIGQDGGPLAGG